MSGGGAARGPDRMGRLQWYRRRLAAMSMAEIAHRVAELGKRRSARLVRPDFARLVRNDTLPELPGLRAGVAALADDVVLRDRWRRLRRDVQGGRIRLLNAEWPAWRETPDWHLDPVTGAHWPAAAYCFDIPYRHADGIGDVKFVWEIGRLQYLQPLAALAHVEQDRALAALCVAHVESWIDGNPPFRGVHWPSGIELALRLISILVVTTLAAEAITPAQRRKIMLCLAAHGWWLRRYPSRFSSANNHLIAEAAGLFILGSVARNLRGARRWAAWGRQILEREALLQFHPDGVPGEQSPTYGAFSLEFLALAGVVGARTGAPFSAAYWERIGAAAGFLRAITDAGGHQPAFGDDDGGRVLFAAPDEDGYVSQVLACLGAALDRPALVPPAAAPQFRTAMFGPPPAAPPAPPVPAVQRFAAGGYTVARHADGGVETLALVDHGPLGYLSIAAHGHADALSLWLHVGGRPVLIDAGTYLYHSGGDWRDYFRGTLAHNTLTIRSLNSSRIAGPFNWSAKATARVVGFDPDPERWAVEAEHDGFVEETGLVHWRRVARVGPRQIEVTDRLTGPGEGEMVEVAFLFAPDLNLAPERGGAGWTAFADQNRPILRLRHEGGLKGWVERGMDAPRRGWHSPAFGLKTPAPRLAFAGRLRPGDNAKFILSVA